MSALQRRDFLTRAAAFAAASAAVGGAGRAAGDELPRSVKDLQKERVKVLTERAAIARKLAAQAAAVEGEVGFWEDRLAVATAERDGRTADLRKLYERRVAAIRAAERVAEEAYRKGVGAYAEILEARDARLEVEIALARLK